MIARIFILFFLSISLQMPAARVQAADKPAAGEDRPIPYKRTGEAETDVSAIRVVLGLGLVLAIGIGAIFAIRRYLPGSYGVAAVSGSRHIDLMEVRRLTPRLTLFLLNIDGEKIVLAQTSEALAVHRLHTDGKDSPDAA